MVSEVFLDCEIIADCVCTAVCYDHGLALTSNLIMAVFQEVGHDHLCLLSDGITVLFIILKQRTGSLTLNEFRVILGHANQPERLFDCGIVCQHIQNITFLDGLPHRVHMERSLDGFTLQRHSHHGTEGFQSLPLGGSGEGKERSTSSSSIPASSAYSLIATPISIRLRRRDFALSPFCP